MKQYCDERGYLVLAALDYAMEHDNPMVRLRAAQFMLEYGIGLPATLPGQGGAQRGLSQVVDDKAGHPRGSVRRRYHSVRHRIRLTKESPLSTPR